LLHTTAVTDEQALLDQRLLPFVPYPRPKVGRRASDRQALDEWYKAMGEQESAKRPRTADA